MAVTVSVIMNRRRNSDFLANPTTVSPEGIRHADIALAKESRKCDCSPSNQRANIFRNTAAGTNVSPSNAGYYRGSFWYNTDNCRTSFEWLDMLRRFIQLLAGGS